MLKFTERTEYAVFIFAIFLLSSGLGGLYLKIFAMDAPLPVELVYFPVWAGMIATILIRFRSATFGVVSILPYVVFTLLAVASYKWSQQPAVTLREAAPSLLYVIYMAAICWQYSWEKIIEAMWTAFIWMVLISVFLYIAVPSIGRMSEIHVGAMAGLWTEKNAAGQIGTFGACIALARLAIRPKTVMTSGFSFLLFTAFLLLSTSKTSLVAYLIACGAFGWVFLMRRNTPVFLFTTWVSVVGGGLALNFVRNNVEGLLGVLGRSSTFTGRADIWRAVEVSMADKPFLGHGFAGYWDKNVYGKTLAYVYDDLQFLPGHAHNSFIDMKLNLGLVGLSIMITALVFYAVVTLLKIRKSNGVYFAVPFMLAAFVIGCFESILGNMSNFGGAIMILVAAKMIRPVLYEETISGLWKTIQDLGQQRTMTLNSARPQHSRERFEPLPEMPAVAQRRYAAALPGWQGERRTQQIHNYQRRSTDLIAARIKGRKPHYPFRDTP